MVGVSLRSRARRHFLRTHHFDRRAAAVPLGGGLAGLRQLPHGPNWRWSITLGVALGLGLLAKYAMIYFLLCAACAAYLDRDARTLLLRPQTWVALAIAGIFLIPNVLWNAENSFVTLRHTGDNIAGSGLHLKLLGPFEFLGSQFALIGPIVFATFLYILARIGRRPITRENRLMLCFAVPPLALVTTLALARTINANWAAPAALSMTILVVAWWRTNGWKYVLAATLWLGLCLQATALVADANAYRISIPALGRQADLTGGPLDGVKWETVWSPSHAPKAQRPSRSKAAPKRRRWSIIFAMSRCRSCRGRPDKSPAVSSI